MKFNFWANEQNGDGEFGGRFHGCGQGREFRGFRGRHGWGHEGWGRGNPFGGPFGGAERLFDQGDLRFVILHLIAERPRHGYEIIKAIEEGTGGSYTPSPGVVYPTLTMLEEMGLASVETTDGNKKLYTITGDGQRVLHENREKVEAILNRMHHTGNRFTGDGMMRALHALAALKQTVKVLVKRGNITDEHVKIVAEALEEAARKIQNL